MIDGEGALDRAIEMLVEARSFPDAQTPEEHVARSQRRYELVHMASELLVLGVIDDIRFEEDQYLRQVDRPAM